jgi:hypothetical protein
MFKIIPLRSSGRSLIFSAVGSINRTAQKAGAHAVASHGGAHVQEVVPRERAYPRIGKREIVGFGKSGEPVYFDETGQPLPAVRWAEDTPEIKALREKAKGDWAALTIAEKKACTSSCFVFY